MWFREREAGLEERYTLADALAVATYLHAFVRHCRVARMANLAQLVNVIAPIVTRPDGLFLQTIYHPLRLFADHLRPVALDVHVDCDTHDLVEVYVPGGWPHRVADLGPFPLLDVTATAAENGDGLTVSVVNRSPTDQSTPKSDSPDAVDPTTATLSASSAPTRPRRTRSSIPTASPSRPRRSTHSATGRSCIPRGIAHGHHDRRGDTAMTETINRRRFLTAAGGAAATMVLGTACSSTYDIAGGFVGPASGSGANTIIYWNLLSGGDGAHMVQMEETYKREHPKVTLDSTVLTWGNPYYTKLAMATRAGSPPDVAIMHLTRINQFAPAKLLTPLDLDLLSEHGMTPADFTPAAFAKAHYNGRLVAIPLDTHPFVQYYNTKVCKKAGLLDSSGQLPPITGPQALLTALRKLKSTGATPAVCDQINDPATPWRLFYTFYSQAGGKVLAEDGKQIVLDRTLAIRVSTFIDQLGKEGLVLANQDAGGWHRDVPVRRRGPVLGGRVERRHLPAGRPAVQHAAVPRRVRPRRVAGRLALVRDPGPAASRSGEAVTGADDGAHAARPEPRVGRRRTHPGVAAGARVGGLPEAQAAVELPVGREPCRVRPAGLVQRVGF